MLALPYKLRHRLAIWLCPEAIETKLTVTADEGAPIPEGTERLLRLCQIYSAHSRPETVSPYLRADGGLTVRIVWRMRQAGLSVVHSATYQTVGPTAGAGAEA